MIVPYSYFVLLFCLFAQSKYCLGDEFLGCGGFVKSKVPIDFSKVEVKLLTPDGIQKYQTECAPNNGYYMVPFVDKGDFVLAVQPPKGWSFEPTSVKLHVDGVNDPCSQGRDINFEFLGFTISGQVSSLGVESGGPDGVTLKLYISDEMISTTTSSDGGAFMFSSVFPGNYKIVASHPSFSFQKDELPISVSQSNIRCSSPLIVSGYEVHGKVSAAQGPVKDVHLLLFSDTPVENVKGCSITPPGGSEDMKAQKGTFICSVTSDDQGSFAFPSLPPREYVLVPFYKAEHIEFDVEPSEMVFSVTTGTVNLPQKFAVTGFSVTGRVTDATDGNPVPDAIILVNGKQQAVTNKKGLYRLQHMNSGMYTIIVHKEDISFPESSVRVGFDTPMLPDIVASGFSLCGRITISVKPTRPFKVEQLSVAITDQTGSMEMTAAVDSDADFCFALQPGTYILRPVLPDAVRKSGVVLSPKEATVTITNKPIKNVNFVQDLFEIKARVSCIDGCHDVSIEMVREGEKQKMKSKPEYEKGKKSAEVTFKDNLVGTFNLQVVQDQWCWEKNKTKVRVADKNEEVTFVQSGFKLICSISHDIDLAIHHDNKLVETFSLKKGRNQLCLAKPGKYQLKIKSCHRFDLAMIVYDTAKPQPVVLQAVSHQVALAIESTHIDESLRLVIKPKTKGKEMTLKLDDVSDKGSKVVKYVSHYLARDGEGLEITPKSNTLLFDPPSYTSVVKADDCDKEFISFKAFQGLFIEGSIAPKIANVDVTIVSDDDESNARKLKTDSNGKYRVGPLMPATTYSISASKDGYVLIQDEKKSGSFVARKLSKIDFTVTMEDSDEPLPGVLMTVSGGSYRSNNMTNNGGSLALQKLEPGQYYFKAIMKEYEFEPSSQVTEVREGDELKIAIKGRRVAYSCFGSVRSLNGQPESDVTVQAYLLEQDRVLAEEAVTNDQGIFRIKGLKPNMEYEVKVKQTDLFDRVSPSEVTVVAYDADVTDARFIGFRALSQFEVSGNVVTDNEFLRHLKVVLYRASDLGTPVHTVSLSSSPFFHLPALQRDNQEYHIRLESSLDKSRYTYTEQAAGFFASGVYKHLSFQFHPQLQAIEHDMPQASLLTLPLTIIILLLAYNHTKVFAWILQQADRYSLGNFGKEAAAEQSTVARAVPRKSRKEK